MGQEPLDTRLLARNSQVDHRFLASSEAFRPVMRLLATTTQKELRKVFKDATGQAKHRLLADPALLDEAQRTLPSSFFRSPSTSPSPPSSRSPSPNASPLAAHLQRPQTAPEAPGCGPSSSFSSSSTSLPRSSEQAAHTSGTPAFNRILTTSASEQEESANPATPAMSADGSTAAQFPS
ncbi:hypothetical protein JCM10213v2_002801 [Rhodosporidiobolus nylandii]